MSISERNVATENHVLAEATVRELRIVLARLASDQLQVISLRLAGLSSSQICAVLGKSRSWVDATQRHAIRRLRALMNVPITSDGE